MGLRKLKVEELFIGMWVRQWSEVAKVYSGYMQVTGIFGEGSMRLVDGRGQYGGTLDDTFGIPIDDDSLTCFGFSTKDGKTWKYKIREDCSLIVKIRERYGKKECWRVSFGGGRIVGWNEDIRHVHELQRWFADKATLTAGIKLELRITK